MSDSDDPIKPFELPLEEFDKGAETFGERLRRRRRELTNAGPPPASTWQSRARTLSAIVVESPHASASIAKRSGDAARALEGVEYVLFASDLPPFHNTLGPEYSGEPLLADDGVYFRGQPVALIVAADLATCQRAASLVEIEYHTTPGILTLEHAVTMSSYHGEARTSQRGDAVKAIKQSKKKLSGSLAIAPQQACLAGGTTIKVAPLGTGEGLTIHSRCLLPTAVRSAVAKAADLPESNIHIEPVDLPGSFGVLETEPVRLASLATHAVRRCGKSVTLHVINPHSPLAGGSRHQTKALYEVGFEKDGTINGIEMELILEGGWYPADSENAMDRALLHADSVYGFPNLSISARLCQTNHIVSSSLPAEGAAQGSWAIEDVIQRVAEATGLSPQAIREKNFYAEEGEVKTTPYGQPVDAAAISRVWQQVLHRSEFASRAAAVTEWNKSNPYYKRGIAAMPIKFGIGDPRSDRNAAAAIVQILADGSVIVRVGLVDTNDGLDAQIREEVAQLLGVEEDAICVILNDFDSLPRATPVIGTDASGLILRALEDACTRLTERLREVALQMFAARGQTEIEMEAIRFAHGTVGTDFTGNAPLHFKEVIEGALRKRVTLIETGYHRTPNLWWDPELGAGWPFTSFTYAAAVAEIQVDAFTGEIQILRLDVAHEGSPSSNQGERDFAQLMRAFTLGAGWMLSEATPNPENEHPDLYPTEEGVFGFADAPFQVDTDRLRPLGSPTTIPGDPCGEAPVILAGALREALWDALRSLGYTNDLNVELPLPATPPKVLTLFKEISRQQREKGSNS